MSEQDSTKGAVMQTCQICGTQVPSEELVPHAYHDAMGNDERMACHHCREGARQTYTGN